MNIKNKIIPLLATTSLAQAAIVTIPVSQDQWTSGVNDGTGYGSNSVIAEGGTGDRLSLWNADGAWQYNRRAYFGFDVSSIDISTATSATFTVTTATDSRAAETGKNVFYWIHADNSGGDSFNQTTLHHNGSIALGLNANGTHQVAGVAQIRGAGTLLQTAGVGIAAADGANIITFSAAALAELVGDSNDFITISAFAGANTSGTYGGPNATTAVNANSMAFKSLESGTGATLAIDVVPEPSSTALLGLGALGLLARRKR